jgi:3-methyl-2-oxobutanoate hydroxymethyltransferase
MNTDTITPADLLAMKKQGQRFATLTVYDASFARLLEQAGVDVLLVGDSLGMVLQGKDSTRGVTMEHMLYHTRSVARGRQRALIMSDMPYQSDGDMDTALVNARQLLQAGADVVKLECGHGKRDIVAHLVAHNVPVCAHVGLLPQSVTEPSGYKIQGKDAAAADAMVADALALQQAGASSILVECVPASLGSRITGAVDVPVIGIGAGPGCDSQVLVLHDMLGITSGKQPRFVKNFLPGNNSVADAVRQFVDEVKSGSFPTDQHSYH